MRVVLSVFFIFKIVIVHSYLFEYVLKPDGEFTSIGYIDFDSDGNIYATAWSYDINFDASLTFYKLNSNKEIILTIPFPSNLSFSTGMQVTSKGDVYFSLHYDDEPSDDISTLVVLRSGSETVEEVEDIGNNFFFLDSNDNLYYEKDNGIHILRPGTSDSVKIKNLDDCEVTYPDLTFDIEGNLYLMVTNKAIFGNISIAVISKEELENDIPEAKLLNFKEDWEFVYNWAVDGSNNVWVTTGTVNSIGYLKKVTDEEYQTVKTDIGHPTLDLTPVKDGSWVIASNGFSSGPTSSSIYFITSDSEVVVIPELQNLTDTSRFLAFGAVDQDERAYFLDYQAEFTPDLGSVIVINPGETKPVPVKLNLIDDAGVINMSIDVNGGVWIKAANDAWDVYHYFLKKGETAANLIPNFTELCEDVKSNPVTKELFFGCTGGLVVAVDENK